MIRYDLHNRYSYLRALSPAAATTDNTASTTVIFDTQGYDGVELVIMLGSLADADATFAVTGAHGDAVDSTSNPTSITDTAAMTNSDLIGTLANVSFDFSADNLVKTVGYKGIKRYIQFTITPSNNSGNAFYSAVFVARPRVAGVTG